MGSSKSQLVALTGRPSSDHCGVSDYVRQLGKSLEAQGKELRVVEVPWDKRGWVKSLHYLRQTLRGRRGQWCLVQYTSLMWSRHAIPTGFLLALFMVKLAGLRVGVIFHDVVPYPPRKPHHWLRKAIQEWIMKAAVDVAEVVVTAVDPGVLPWIDTQSRRRKAVGIPVGSNIPSLERRDFSSRGPGSVPAIAVFSVDGREEEISTIIRAVKGVSTRVPKVELKVVGRGSSEVAERLMGPLKDGGVQVSVYGVQSPEELTKILGSADVQLAARGSVSSRRGSVIAGIGCGLPVVGYRNWETASPITEAGVYLVPEGDTEALVEALAEVLSNEELRGELGARSEWACRRYFDWKCITTDLLRALSSDGLHTSV